jgi:hypothetical protein
MHEYDVLLFELFAIFVAAARIGAIAGLSRSNFTA